MSCHYDLAARCLHLVYIAQPDQSAVLLCEHACKTCLTDRVCHWVQRCIELLSMICIDLPETRLDQERHACIEFINCGGRCNVFERLVQFEYLCCKPVLIH